MYRSTDNSAQSSRSRLVAVDEHNRPIGEDHHRAKLSDRDVELIRQMYEEGMGSARQLGELFGCSKTTVWEIVSYLKRSTTPAGYRRITLASTATIASKIPE